MIQSQKLKENCREKYMRVTCDLAKAEKAFQIQLTESARFNNLLIHVGPFHIILACFKVIGNFIDICGLSSIIFDPILLANCSVNYFIAEDFIISYG